jgi:tetratricopeptide (TPR) repeat protein
MNNKTFWLSIVAVLASFAGGFLVANSLNRKDLTALRAENENLKKAQNEVEASRAEMTLSDEEIKKRIAEADENPTDLTFQKNLGFALYNYASMKQDADLLGDVSRLLKRVYENNPNDYKALVTLGDIDFDIGYFTKNNDNFQKARGFYQKALEQKSNDVEVRTDLGLTYLWANPPEAERAVNEFQKSLEINPKHEKTLQAMVQALNSQNKRVEVEKYTARLRQANPKNPSLNENESVMPLAENKSNQKNQ